MDSYVYNCKVARRTPFVTGKNNEERLQDAIKYESYELVEGGVRHCKIMARH